MEKEFSFTDDDFRFLAKLVTDRTGIMLPDQKKDMVYGRLARRLRTLGLDGFKEYCKLCESEQGHEEMGHLVNAITTNVTRFFREPHHFEHLSQNIVTNDKKGMRHKIRIWSAGCSMGHEPYSIAMTMCERFPDHASQDIKILATDIDTNVLAKGKSGQYSESDVENIPANLKNKYFTCLRGAGSEDLFQADEALKRMIRFNQLNLLHNWPMKGPFDVIFCRNVVIYFNKDTQRSLFNRYASMLKPGGWLYIGHSENLVGLCDRFEPMGKTTYQKIK